VNPKLIRKGDKMGRSLKQQRMEDPDGLTAKQRAFVNEYLADFNGAQAAIRAGYSEDTAGQIAHGLLKKEKVQTALQKLKKGRANRWEVNADNVLLELARIAFADPRAMFHEDGRLKQPHELDDNTAAAVQSIEVVTRGIGDGEVEYVSKIRYHSKTKGLEMLAKHLGLLEERIRVETDNPLALLLAVVEQHRDQRPAIVDDSYIDRIAQGNRRMAKGLPPPDQDHIILEPSEKPKPSKLVKKKTSKRKKK
jgi:phage terminase small subunit